MVKAYLRYEHSGVFGVISSNSNVLYDASGKQVITGALENIALWNVRQGTQVRERRKNTQVDTVTTEGRHWCLPSGSSSSISQAGGSSSNVCLAGGALLLPQTLKHAC
jgi:hypothetical protein